MTHAPVQLPIHDDQLRAALRRSAWLTAIIAGAFIAIVASVMLLITVRDRSTNLALQTSTDLLKHQLTALPGDMLRLAIRAEDQRLRDAYFGHRALLFHGAWLLVGGTVVLIISLKLAWSLSAGPYLPTGHAPDEAAQSPQIRLSVGVAGAILAVILLLLGFSRRSHLPAEPSIAPIASLPPATPPGVGKVTVAEKPPEAWPAFRGDQGDGIASGVYPTSWDGAAGKGVLWKTKVPQPGNSSPIVCAGRVFVTGGLSQRREVYCFDSETGALQWTKQVGPDGGPEPKLAADTGWAPSTMACDGARVFAIFPTGELAAFDLTGSLQWAKHLGVPDNLYGHASSLRCDGGLLYVQFDQGTDAKSNKSVLLAFDCVSGKEAWRVTRPVVASWSTPIVVPSSGSRQLVTLGDPWMIAYDAKLGVELWRAKGLSGEIAPSPAFADGFVYAATEQSRLFQIRLDGHGDVTTTHVKKIDSDGLPDIVSPLALKGRVMLVQTSGSVTWSDLTAAKDVWIHDYAGQMHASPVAAGNLIYLVAGDGVTHVIEAADTFKEIAASPLGQAVNATPALSGGRIFIRGQDDLFCIGAR